MFELNSPLPLSTSLFSLASNVRVQTFRPTKITGGTLYLSSWKGETNIEKVDSQQVNWRKNKESIIQNINKARGTHDPGLFFVPYPKPPRCTYTKHSVATRILTPPLENIY